MVRNLKSIAAKEGVTMSEDAMHIIAQKADGAMRDALTLFDQTVAFCGREVTYEQVIQNLNVLDYDYYFSLTDDFLKGDYAHAMLTFDEILSKGFNAQSFIGGLSSHFRDLLVCKNEASRTLLELAPSVAARYAEVSGRCSAAFLFEALSITSGCEAAYKQSGNPRLLIEFALMKICNITVKFAAAAQVPAPATAPTPAPAKEPAPAVAPAPGKAPVPETPRKPRPTGLSIKAMMEEAESGPASVETTPAAAPAEQKNNDPERITKAWKALAESESKTPRLSNAISMAKPVVEGKVFHFEVGNMAQKEWIDRTCRSRMEAFLQKNLGDSSIKLTIDVKPAEETGRGIYMPSDKAKYLQENSPEFNKLKDDLKLEIS